MNVGIVCPYDLGAPGGVQRVCMDLAAQLRGMGDSVILVGPGEGDGWISVGSTIPIMANESRVPVALTPALMGRVDDALAGVDVVHVHEPLIPLVGWAAMRVEKPIVATFHADPPEWARNLYSRFGKWLTKPFRRASITAVSDVAASALPDDWGAPHIIPNGVDVSSYEVDTPRDWNRVVFLGRDDPRKGLDVILEAWPAIRAVHPEAHLMVVGVSRNEAPDGVTYAGRVREGEKRRLLAGSAVMVAPNLGGESFGIVLAEAMAAGCAVVASDIQAFRDVAQHAAAYVAPGDVEGWSETVVTLLRSPEWIDSLQSAGRRRVRDYDWATVTAAYRSVYEEATTS